MVYFHSRDSNLNVTTVLWRSLNANISVKSCRCDVFFLIHVEQNMYIYRERETTLFADSK